MHDAPMTDSEFALAVARSEKHPHLTDRIAAALDAHDKARTAKAPYVPSDNPLFGRKLEDLTRGAGMTKPADMTRDERSGRKEHLGDTRKKRARAAAERKSQIDAIAESTKPVDPTRMMAAWFIVDPLLPIIERIAHAKSAWAARFLGDIADDVTGNVVEACARVFAKSDKDLALLRVAADQLGDDARQQALKRGEVMVRRATRIPGNQEWRDKHGEDMPEDVKAQAKREAKARKWLMGVINNRVMAEIADAHQAEHNIRWENIDTLTTVLASIRGVGEDPLVAHTKASVKPGMIGATFPGPKQVAYSGDPNLVAMAIAAGITARKLDPLVELLLANLRTDGSFPWAEHAQAVFTCLPFTFPGGGTWAWQQVCKLTKNMADPRAARATEARLFVRKAFAWLPGFIVAVIDRLSVDGDLSHVHIEADVEHTLVFTDVTEAAHALAEALDKMIDAETVALSLGRAAE